MERDEALREFRKVRAAVDEDCLLDGYDFALGWLLGKGVSHETATSWIESWGASEDLTWPALENLKEEAEEEAKRQAFVKAAVKQVTG